MKPNNIQENEEVIQLTPEMIKSIEEGLEDVKAGRVIPHEDVMKEIDNWLNELSGP